MYLISISGSLKQIDLMIKIKKYLESANKNFYVMIPNNQHDNDADDSLTKKLENIYQKQISEADLCIYIPKFVKDKEGNIEYINNSIFDFMYKNSKIQEIGEIRHFFGESTRNELYYHLDKTNIPYVIYSYENCESETIISRSFILDFYNKIYKAFGKEEAERFFKNIID